MQHDKVCFLTIVILLLSAAPNSSAQKLPDDRLKDAEVHLGAGFHQLIHVGGRFRIDPFIMLEAGVGSDFPFKDADPHTSFSVGFTLVPRSAQRNPGFIFSVLYSAWHKDSIEPWESSGWSGFIHFITGNIGWVMQHFSGFSFLARLGGGIAAKDYNYRGHGGGIYTEDYVEFWPNLEIALGYAL